MGKELSEMTLAELWELFPIHLVEHNDRWKQYYDEIERLLSEALSEYQIKRISHIGSTAIDGIWAKDIVDVLVEIAIVSIWRKLPQKSSSAVLSECPPKTAEFRLTEDIQRTDLRKRFFTFTCGMRAIMTNHISGIILMSTPTQLSNTKV